MHNDGIRRWTFRFLNSSEPLALATTTRVVAEGGIILLCHFFFDGLTFGEASYDRISLSVYCE